MTKKKPARKKKATEEKLKAADQLKIEKKRLAKAKKAHKKVPKDWNPISGKRAKSARKISKRMVSVIKAEKRLKKTK